MPGISVDQFLDYSSKGQVAVEADHPSLAARGAIDGVLASALCEDLREE
jgi:hypothetical protein